MAQKKSSHRTAEEKAATAAKRDARRARTERARAQAEERRKAAKRKEQLTRFGLVAGVLALIVGGYFLVTNLGSDKPDTAPSGASGNYGMVIGDADAPKEIVVYEDFLCPFCGQLEKTVRDQLDAAVEAGEVNVEYRPLPFLERISDYSPESANAFAVVLDASGPEVAKAFHDLLFDNQPSEEGPFPSKDDLVDLAVEAGARGRSAAGVAVLAVRPSAVVATAHRPRRAGVTSREGHAVEGHCVKFEVISVRVSGWWPSGTPYRRMIPQRFRARLSPGRPGARDSPR